MPAVRRLTARRLGPASGITATLALVLLGTAVPASAHGAPTNPLSRAAACGTEGGASAGTAACRAARAANGDPDFADWDNLRVADVDGRDRQVIPDGHLCSAGLPAFRGLDLPRPDWPASTLTPGATMTFSYRATIPHEGQFRFYVTRDGYDPTRPLRWADLEAEPFLRVVDPPLTDGAYRITGTLPKDRTGRHLIYTIWQNAGPDTYYSCSDVVFRAVARVASTPKPSKASARSAASASATTAVPEPSTASAPATEPPATGSASSAAQQPSATDVDAAPAAAEVRERAWTLPALVGLGALVVGGAAVVAAVVAALVRRRRW